MAIVIEEDRKKKSSFGPLIGWGAIVVIVAVAVYYIFFVTPPAAPLPGESAPVAPVVPQFNVQPDAVLNNPTFQSLKTPNITLPTPQGPGAVGRANPFILP